MSCFCVLPWNHLATHPHGIVSLCCESDHTDSLSVAKDFSDNGREIKNLNTHSISEIRNSDYFKQVRLQMLKGQTPEACIGCVKKEKSGALSKRQIENRNFPNFDISRALESTGDDGATDHHLQFVELRLGNLCNLKCRTCNPASSTKWVNEYQGIQSKLDFLQRYDGELNFNWPQQVPFWDELFSQLDHGATFYINGGEPTLIEAHWDFLQKLIESGRNQSAKLIYSINMTQVPKRAISLWKQFPNLEIRASIDDLYHRNEYIRHPSRWKTIEQSLLKLEQEEIVVSILQTVSCMNFFYLDSFHQYFSERGYGISHNFVTEPNFLSPMALPLSTRASILNRLKTVLPKDKWKILFGLFGDGGNPQLYKRFYKYTEVLDKTRGESFSQVFPELSELLL